MTWQCYNKYSAKKVILPDGEKFDSRREYQRWNELLLLKRAGEITDLERQVKYHLIPAQKGKDGRVLERGVDYVADFVYKNRNGELVVEDTKGVRTPEYIIKRKLMLWRLGIRIREV